MNLEGDSIMNTGTLTAECAMKAQDVGVLLRPRRQLYRVGDSLLYNGDVTPYCYKVVKGAIALSRTDENYKTTIFCVVTPGKFFGEEALFGDCRRHDARALIESVVKKEPTTPDVIVGLVKDLLERSYFLEALLVAPTKCERMHLIAQQYDISALPRSAIAEMTSARREMASRQLKVQKETS